MDSDSRNLNLSKLFRDIMSLLRQNMAKVFEDSGITAPQGMVIGTLSKYGKMKISDLGNQLGLTNSTISGIIDRLEKQDMVIRERSLEDKRVVFVSITPKFKEITQDFHNKIEENITNIMNRGTPEEIIKIAEGLNTLKKLLGTNKKNDEGTKDNF
jgi:MarR family transcriptional regulator, organic hydroperoxide resistance regulator